MRFVGLSLSQLSILLVSLLLLSTQLLWAQRTSTLEAVQLPDAPSQVATVSEAQTHLHVTDKGLPLSFRQNRGQTESWTRFFPDRTGYGRLSININAKPNEDKGAAEFWGKNKYFIGSAPTKWLTFAPAYGHVHHETIHSTNDLEYYGHHIPWAGFIVLRIDQQAKAHPHITSVAKMIQPKF
jgi:hypothetical protein